MPILYICADRKRSIAFMYTIIYYSFTDEILGIELECI